MKYVDKKNIIFLFDENTPYYAKEFTLLSDEEIVDLVERRLFSNNYFDYTIHTIHKSKGIITLIRDTCGHKLETTLSKIEDGLISEKCTECRQEERASLIALQEEIQEEVKDRGLTAVLYETDKKTDSLYIECSKCGKKYYLDKDFKATDFPKDMYCKNWDCMMDALALEDHWFGKGIKTGDIKILELDYSPCYDSQFIMDYEDWFYSLGDYDGTYDIKCSKCGAHRIVPFGGLYEDECVACFYVDQNDFEITKWDKIDEKVYIHCLHCDSRYVITEEQANDEVFDCFSCFEQKNKVKTICPVCHTELPKDIRFCDTCGFCLDVLNNNEIQSQEQYTHWLVNTIAYCDSIWYTSKKEIDKLKSELENFKKTLKQSEDSVRALSQTNLDLIDVVNALSFSNADRCTKNRSVRKKIAEANGIVYLSSECTNSSMCTGVCDSCNAETRYFNSEIKRLESEGHKIIIPEEVFSCYIPDISSVAPKIKLSGCGLPPVALNPLGRYGVKTLGQLSDMSSAELFGVPSLGKNGYKEAIKVLSKFGLTLKEN